MSKFLFVTLFIFGLFYSVAALSQTLLTPTIDQEKADYSHVVKYWYMSKCTKDNTSKEICQCSYDDAMKTIQFKDIGPYIDRIDNGNPRKEDSEITNSFNKSLFRCISRKSKIDDAIKNIPNLKWIEKADFNVDLNKALEKRDCRFLSLDKEGEKIPGIEDSAFKKGGAHSYKLLKNVLVWPLESDMSSVPELRSLAIKAFMYASKYNKRMLEEQKTNKNCVQLTL